MIGGEQQDTSRPWSPRASIGAAVAASLLGVLVIGRGVGAEEAGGRLAIVVHPSNPIAQMTKAEAKRIFLKKTVRWTGSGALRGQKILAIDLPMRDAARKTFSRAVLGVSVATTKRYWISQRLKGAARPPLTVRSAQAAARIIERKKNAVGYLPLDLAKKAKVKVILEIGG